MQKKNKKTLKLTITISIIIFILLLLILLTNIVNKQNKNKIALSESTPTTLVGTEPNIPKISAGMIPVKWDGSTWIITTVEDNDWYNYSEGKPAYVMLNDGYYKSELERGVNEEQLAENNVGMAVLDDPNTAIHTRNNLHVDTTFCIQ